MIFADGVYLGLSHDVYLSSEARTPAGVVKRLGSTDFTRLFARGRGWWWTSENNKFHVSKSTDATIFGDALHKLSLEGRAAYDAEFAVMPNPNDYPGLLRTAPEIYSALKAANVKGLKAKMPKNELVQQGKAFLPEAHIWDDIVERWERGLKGRTPLEASDSFAIEAMFASAMAEPEARALFGVDQPIRLTEVSVFYTPADGIPRRFRFDALLPDAIIDLKSFAEWKSQSLDWLIGSKIAADNLDVQMAMSHEARRHAYRLIDHGQIFHLAENGVVYATGPDRDWLARFPGEAPLNGGGAPGWCFAWIFYQKPEGGAAPELVPVRVGYDDDLHRNGWRKYQIALKCYVENVAKFGLDKPWTGVSALYDTSPKYQRRIVVPAYSDQPIYQPGEEEALSWHKKI